MNAYRKKAAGAVLAAVLLAGGATACEDGKGAGGAGKDGAAAAPSAAAPKPAEVTPAAFLEKTQAKAAEITSVRYTMAGTAGGQTISGEAAMRLKPSAAMAMKMANPEKPGESVDIRLLDGALYLGAEGKYLKFDLKSLDPEAAKKLDRLGGAQQGENPGDRAGDMSAAKDLKTVGEETVDGQKTTHLSGTVTLDELRAASAAGTPEAKERRGKNLQALEAQGIKSLAMDIWIDENHQTKQFRTRGEGTEGPMDITVKFLDVNKPVDIAAPPADQVVDLAQLTQEG
ncbi:MULTISPECIES: hypothetical protein [Streptomyces]|uniref:hypothetical protein n=1 Tax=Streptomyces TaxID=1883 RepID=UPI0021B06EEF|nr:hypothetical protein [Streptomyces sp. WAC05292]